jgi:hypothetical protein
LRRVEHPDLDWFRELYLRIGAEWLWFSRVRMSDIEFAAIIHSLLVEVYALVHEGRDEGLLELDFRTGGQCELAFFGLAAELIGTGAGRWMMNRAIEPAWSRAVARVGAYLHLRSSGRVALPSAFGFPSIPWPDRDRRRSADRWHCAAQCRKPCADHWVSGSPQDLDTWSSTRKRASVSNATSPKEQHQPWHR